MFDLLIGFAVGMVLGVVLGILIVRNNPKVEDEAQKFTDAVKATAEKVK